VLEALVRRTGVTVELTLYSVLALIPLGLIGGVIAGWRAGQRADSAVRLAAFIGTAFPPFILGLTLLSIFYVGLDWFAPGRTSLYELSLSTSTFQAHTGLLTIDGLLNGRFDVTLDALRHLVLPVITLGLVHWATLTRVTRTAIIEERHRDYIMAAHARGLKPRSIVWRHAFRNTLAPALTSSALSAASLITAVFIVEIVFNLNGLSELIVAGFAGTPDAPLAMGFAVYSVLLVLPLMFLLDLVKAIVDPRVREGVLE
jgi:peptide/nickel transport system permease protein